jgi:hypothetical protein
LIPPAGATSDPEAKLNKGYMLALFQVKLWRIGMDDGIQRPLGKGLPLSVVPYQRNCGGINLGRQVNNNQVEERMERKKEDVHQQNAIPPIQLDEEPSAED